MARQREGRGLRGRDISAAALPRRRGSYVREEHGVEPRTPPLSCPSLEFSPKPRRSPCTEAGAGVASRRDGGPQSAGRWVGWGARAAGTRGEGKEGMPSHEACRARARRHPGADPMRAHVPWNRDIPPETGGPLPAGCPSRGCPRCGIKGLSGFAGWILRLRRGGAMAGPNPGDLGTRSCRSHTPLPCLPALGWLRGSARATLPIHLSI